MQGVRKKFDKFLYEANDKLAKQAVLKYLKGEWKENPKKRGPDLINEDGTKYVECEIKLVWSGDKFAYKDVQIPERKGKWKDLDITFFILNKECTHAIKFSGNSLKEEYLREVSNKFVYRGEYFYGIPLSECEVIKL